MSKNKNHLFKINLMTISKISAYFLLEFSLTENAALEKGSLPSARPKSRLHLAELFNTF